MQIQNNKGFTLVEVLVASVILAISSVAMLEAFDFLGRHYSQAKTMVNEDRMLAAWIDNLRMTAKYYQTSFSPSNEIRTLGSCTTGLPEKLECFSFSFGDQGMVPASKHPEYPGRMEFIVRSRFISASDNSKRMIPSGLYDIVIRVVRDKTIQPLQYKDYAFTTGGS